MKTGSLPRLAISLAVAALASVTIANYGITSGIRAAAAPLRPALPIPPKPFFHFLWKEEISEPAVRAAVADTTGDGAPRFILLCQNPLRSELASLMIKKWNGTEFITEFTGEVNGAPDKLAVGRFAGPNKPAVIVTADALWVWNGQKYVRKPSARPLPVFGAARKHSGEECLILSDSEKQFKSYAVNPDAANDWLIDQGDAPMATQVDWESMRATPVFFEKMGMPTFLGSGGLITIWDTSKANHPYLFCCRPAPDLGAAANGAAPKVDSFVTFRDATDLDTNELWTTTKLNGLATDLALEDAKTAGKRGLLILTNLASAGKARTIYFYGLD